MRYKHCDPINGCGRDYQHSLDKCPHCGASCQFSNVKHDPRDIIYDIETYPNIFVLCSYHVATSQRHQFEISVRRNQLEEMYEYLNDMIFMPVRMVGFNNVGFDYPVINQLLLDKVQTCVSLYNVAMEIINTPWDKRFEGKYNVKPWEIMIQQLDLMLIHHFDNDARRTSLKQLEFFMRSEYIQDLPFSPGKLLSSDEMDELIKYCHFDVEKTYDFYLKSLDMIEFREGLEEKYDQSFDNASDAKIGSRLMIDRIGRNVCYTWKDGQRETNKTIRSSIDLSDAIFPYVRPRHPEFRRILDWLNKQRIYETKGVFEKLIATVDGVEYKFGLGGIHASVSRSTYYTSHSHTIVDVDVTSYYPSLGIVNKIYPEHLGEDFYLVNEEVKQERLQYERGSMQNKAYKLALNAGFGNSNCFTSPFYDPLYTMKITINGQLLLCMLAENLLDIPSVEIIQANTDGITYRCENIHLDQTRKICKQWEQFTCLKLDEAIYNRMHIRDVNNYWCEYKNGSIKRKGAYEYKKEFHQDASSLVIPKAVEAHLSSGESVRDFITNHRDDYDFMLFFKPGGNGKQTKLMLDDTQIQSRSRYYVSIDGGRLYKIMPAQGPLGQYKRANGISEKEYNEWHVKYGNVHNPDIHTKNKSIYEDRHSDIQSGWLCSIANDMSTFDRKNINYEWYIREAEKLIEGVGL